jgi:hypothetical protein
MDSKELQSCRRRLEAFLVELLEPVGRLERRRWGNAYVRVISDNYNSRLATTEIPV